MPRPNNSSGTALHKQVYSKDFVEPCDGQGLIYHLSRFLELVELSILRCPCCTHICLRARADAEHCSRRCQANTYARVIANGLMLRRRRGRYKEGKRNC